MKIIVENRIHDNIVVLEGPYYPSYLIIGHNALFMIDAGINLLGPRYIGALQQAGYSLEQLDYLLLTHSHYDHLGALSYLKKKTPALPVGGHERLMELLQKTSVCNTMNFLSKMQKNYFPELEFKTGKEGVDDYKKLLEKEGIKCRKHV